MPRQKSTHVDDPKAVGRRLREARKASGLSQRQLAFLGCSPAYISRIEAGDRIPSLQLLRELGRRLGVSEDFLATGAESGAFVSQPEVEMEVALRLGDLGLAERLAQRALEGGTNAEQAAGLAGLGRLAFARGEPRQAIESLEQALARYGGPELNHAGLADTLGRAYSMVGEFESAIGLFEHCLDEANRRRDFVESLRFSVLLGNCLIDSGNLGRAEELLGRALALGRDSSNPSVRARLYWSQSRLHAERSDPETAAHYALRTLEILRTTEDTYHTARAHQLLAHIELDRDNAEEALAILEEGRPLIEASGNELERAQYRLEEARALAKLGRSEEAAALAMQISGLISTAHPEDAARSYSVLAGVFENLGDRSRARELYELAAELLERDNPNRFLVDVYAKLADLCEGEGRSDEAYRYMKKAVGMQQELAETPARR